MTHIKFDTDNQAFEMDKEYEVARILKEIAKKVENGYIDGTIHDTNGNNVGHWHL